MIKKGNIGVYLGEDNGALYRVRFINDNDLIKIEDIKSGFTRWIYKTDFWPLLDKLTV